jgi:hypothetical protein
MSEQLIAWVISSALIVSFLIGYFIGRYEEHKKKL